MTLAKQRSASTAIVVPTASPKRPRFNEQLHTLRALNAHRQAGLHIPDFDPQRDRYIILADVHRGEGHALTDDFHHNEHTYLDALRFYLDAEFRLVLNGDIEELWKSDMATIRERYAHSAYALEREFVKLGPGHYLRTFGNHDDDWQDEREVARWLGPLLGRDLKIYPSISLGNKITIAHGHQGDLTSDRIKGFSRQFVRHVWRPLQERFGAQQDLKHARNNPIRTNRDRSLVYWARTARQLLIAGHTHRALFHPEKHTSPNYINTGACIHKDGLTGIELDRGEIRLVRWQRTPATPASTRTVVQSGELGRILAQLS